VIKIERPVSVSDRAEPWVIRDEGNAHVEKRADALIHWETKAAMGEDRKAYFHGEWSAEGWKIGARVLPQHW
jgi:hypothetical protein